MIDSLALVIGFFLISLLIIIIFVGVKFLYNIATIGQAHNSFNEKTDKRVIEDSKEDSNGDGLLLFDEPLFPEEFDEE